VADERTFGTGDTSKRKREVLKFLVALSLVLVAILVSFVFLRPKRVDGSGAIVGYTSPPSPSGITSSSGTVRKLRVAVLKGASTGCQPTGGCGSANYAQKLAYYEGWILSVFPKGGTGYVAGGSANPPTDFTHRLPAVVASKPDVVLVEGSSTDRFAPTSRVQAAVVDLLTALRNALPAARIIVIGPIWAGGAVPSDLIGAENAVRDGARGRVDMYIDPIAERWFPAGTSSLMGADHESPTDAGHAVMAQMLEHDISSLKLPSGVSG
jgi:hypothetical protein